MRTHILQIAKAAFIAVCVSLVFVLVFTVIIELFNLPMEVVKPVNQAFKIISIFVGGLIFIRGEKGLIKGAIYGVAAVILTFLLFGIISSTLSADWKFLVEILLGAVVGAISGIIGVNLKRNV